LIAFSKAHRKFEVENEIRRKAESKVNEIWAKLEQEQNMRSQLAQTSQHASEKIACLEKQFANISDKFKTESENNVKLKKANAELTLSCSNKEKLIEEMTEKIDMLQKVNTNQANDIANLQIQLDKAHVNWMQINGRTQDLESNNIRLFALSLIVNNLLTILIYN
jgi:chromosome segregation ATPase